jgi:hypothetical protein
MPHTFQYRVPGEELIDEFMRVANNEKANLDLGEHASIHQSAEIYEHERDTG